MLPLVLAATLAIISVGSFITGWPSARVWPVAGVAASALLAWLGVVLLLRHRRERAADEARLDEDEQEPRGSTPDGADGHEDG